SCGPAGTGSSPTSGGGPRGRHRRTPSGTRTGGSAATAPQSGSGPGAAARVRPARSATASPAAGSGPSRRTAAAGCRPSPPRRGSATRRRTAAAGGSGSRTGSWAGSAAVVRVAARPGRTDPPVGWRPVPSWFLPDGERGHHVLDLAVAILVAGGRAADEQQVDLAGVVVEVTGLVHHLRRPAAEAVAEDGVHAADPVTGGEHVVGQQAEAGQLRVLVVLPGGRRHGEEEVAQPVQGQPAAGGLRHL